MNRVLVSVALALGVVSLTWADDKSADPTKVSLDKVRAAFRAEIDKADQAMMVAFDKAATTARQTGDKVVLDRIMSERLAFELTGALPTWTPPVIQKRLGTAQRNSEEVYAQAVKAYTKAAQDDKAAAVQKELIEFRKQPTPVRFFSLINEKSGLVLAAAKSTADRGSGLVQAKDGGEPHQQWSFIPTNNSEVYLIKNRQSAHYLNIGGAHRVEVPVTLWSIDAAEHNHWVITRVGKHFRIRDANGESYLAPVDASTDENKAVIQAAKGDGDEQVWRLAPVKLE